MYAIIGHKGGEDVAKYTQAKQEANARYDAKTYKKIGIALRIDEDAEIIRSWQEAHEHGISSREWLKAMFEGGGVQTDKIKSALEQNGLSNEQIAKIMRLL